MTFQLTNSSQENASREQAVQELADAFQAMQEEEFPQLAQRDPTTTPPLTPPLPLRTYHVIPPLKSNIPIYGPHEGPYAAELARLAEEAANAQDDDDDAEEIPTECTEEVLIKEETLNTLVSSDPILNPPRPYYTTDRLQSFWDNIDYLSTLCGQINGLNEIARRTANTVNVASYVEEMVDTMALMVDTIQKDIVIKHGLTITDYLDELPRGEKFPRPALYNRNEFACLRKLAKEQKGGVPDGLKKKIRWASDAAKELYNDEQLADYVPLSVEFAHEGPFEVKELPEEGERENPFIIN